MAKLYSLVDVIGKHYQDDAGEDGEEEYDSEYEYSSHSHSSSDSDEETNSDSEFVKKWKNNWQEECNNSFEAEEKKIESLVTLINSNMLLCKEGPVDKKCVIKVPAISMVE